MHENEIAKEIFNIGLKIHRELGPGLLESAYEECLCYELKEFGFQFARQKPLPLMYKSIKMDAGYRVDILVEDKVIIEVKSIESIAEIHKAQVITYLRLSSCKLGLLINFNSVLFKDGFKRIVNGLD